MPLLEQLDAEAPLTPRISAALAQAYLRVDRATDAIRVIESLPNTAEGTDELDLLLAEAHFASNDPDQAMTYVRRAPARSPRNPRVNTTAGAILMERELWSQAERAFLAALEADPDNEFAHNGLAGVYIETHQYDRAAEHALRAVSLMHFFPAGHYRLGVALARLKQYDRAAHAIELALSMQPGFLNAHRYLVGLYTLLNEPARAMLHRHKARAILARRTIVAA